MGNKEIGLIGLGTIGQVAHVPALAREGHGLRLVVAADLNPPKSSDIRVFPDYRDVLHHNSIVAVSIATPPNTQSFC